MKKFLVLLMAMAFLVASHLALSPGIAWGAATNVDILTEDTGAAHTTGEMWIDPCKSVTISGTWTCTAGTNLYYNRLTNSSNADQVIFNVAIPSQSTSGKGYRIDSFDVFFNWGATGSIGTSVILYEVTLPADNAAFSGAVKATTKSKTYLQMIAAQAHKVTYTVTSPSFSSTGVVYQLEITTKGNSSAQYDLYGVKLNYTYNWH